MGDRRKSARQFWDLFPGCAWCHNTRRLIVDRAVGEVVCPFCKES